MRRSLPLLALVVILLAYASHGALWRSSVDLAHHYALVARLTQYAGAAFPYDPSLVEMNAYPRYAHQLAAQLGRWLGSPLLGMQALSVLGMAGAWAGLVWLLMQLPQRMAVVAAAGMAALLVLNRYVLHLPIHGDELIGNFFLPQLLGQALAVLLMLACWHWEQQGRAPIFRYLLLAPAVYLLAGVHLLPALVLLAVMALLVATDLVMEWRSRQSGARALPGVLALLCAAAGVFQHPTFATMREISKNNGHIELPYLDSVAAQMGYGAAIALVSLALLLYWMRHARLTVIKYVAVYGLAVSGLALAQGVALHFGMGSDYALRKYAYALNTVALILLALLPALPWARKPESGGAQWAHWLLPPLLTILACLAVAAQPAQYKARQLAKLEHSVQLLHERIGPATGGQIDYVIGTGQDEIIEYMLSLGQMRMPRLENANANSLLYTHQIAEWRNIGRVITAEHSAYDPSPACRIGAPEGGLVALDGACVARYGVSGTRIDFTAASKIFPCALTGFSHREPGGSWTGVRQVTLRCPRLQVNGKPPGHVVITANAFRSEIESRRAIATVDGLPPQTTVYGAKETQMVLPLRADSQQADVVIQVDLPDAVSPAQLGLSTDPRLLGLSVQALEFKD